MSIVTVAQLVEALKLIPDYHIVDWSPGGIVFKDDGRIVAHIDLFTARLWDDTQNLEEKVPVELKALVTDRWAGIERVVQMWNEIETFLTDDQGFIYDEESAECQTCGMKAATIDEITHEDDCFTDAFQRMRAVVERLAGGE